jgi:hypothetical protein
MSDSREIERKMLAVPIRLAHGDSPPPAELGAHLTTLARAVLDLMMEVEALRRAAAGESDYRAAYRSTGLLTHDCGGPSGGWARLLEQYYPREDPTAKRSWRESAMLKRLGASQEEILAYQREAEGLEFLT